MCPIIQNLPFKYSAHWKQQGITYLQYLGLNTKAVRGCLKVDISNKEKAWKSDIVDRNASFFECNWNFGVNNSESPTVGESN